MDSHQRRMLRRKMKRLGLPEVNASPPSLESEDKGTEPLIKWQDAVGVLGVGLAIGGMADMPILFRLVCFGLCAVLMPISFFSHRGWPIPVRWIASIAVVAIMSFMSYHALRADESKSAKAVVINWDNPKPISAGTPLSKDQLNATATDKSGKAVEGEFVYDPSESDILSPGSTHTLHVKFIPKDASAYRENEKTVVIVVDLPPSINSSNPPPVDKKSLEQRTILLAQDIYDWSITRDVERNSVKQQAMAQAFISAMKGEKNGAEEFRGRLASWENETMSQFLNLYWPKVVQLQDELHAVGADTSPLSRAEAAGNPERIALMLSIVAERIGKRPPFPRQITQLQIRAITRDLGSPNVEVYADLEDSNSRQIAEKLRGGFSAEKSVSVNKAILPLAAQTPKRHGIWTIYPSADMATELNGFIPILDACEVENKWEVRSMKQPPTIVKIQVWPATEHWEPPVGPNLIR